ncbi:MULTISPECIES: ABC transporter permease [Rhizobium]|uniref:ABC transporter permease n=2 Tax=Rhizobium/Agrobacterium group TaxID=227290 RepID=A0ABY8IM07_9HYPH|nr:MULTISPECIES: ABC transporter permease [Rhizobium]MBZ5760678.1 ABC transporter permease [Rhizobium sp. VS19-DR96]MBZ5765538.1 ABC transporter permease [Rhizobium sp. VS19-DR129.2]MBZ5774457.1 ABC transporter permease [Rhizobium sp. VS19-DRK62.2]MBZ5784513.1 ABC transporter permease [Rhizobium sp. VS19-DR121]MBZ5801125.1 ABC transporter permease [Rhizobium sp. VS19-DR181]
MEVRPATGRTMPIVKAVLRFVGIAITTYLGLLAVTFFIGRVVPIDPVLAILGDRAPAHVIERVRRELGLDLPLYEQFYIYLKGVLSGDFGTSVLTTNPVMTDIRRAFPATLELATLGTIIGSVIGVPLGVLAAVRRGSLIDQLVRVIGLIGYSVPIFWMALISLVIFYAKLKWVAFPGRIDITYEYTFTPITGLFLLDSALQGEWDVFADVFRHIILPASLLGYFSLAYISRMTRSFMLNELGQEYIVAVRAKGLSETRVIWAHALRNAAVPLVTVIALSYAGLLEGSVLTETVFSWPGIGFYITNSLQNADMNAVLGGTIVIGTVFIGINLLSDILYRTLDPRTRRQ